MTMRTTTTTTRSCTRSLFRFEGLVGLEVELRGFVLTTSTSQINLIV